MLNIYYLKQEIKLFLNVWVWNYIVQNKLCFSSKNTEVCCACANHLASMPVEAVAHQARSNYIAKIQMEFELMVDALEFKLRPRVFIEYSSTFVDLCVLIVFSKIKIIQIAFSLVNLTEISIFSHFK